jgi:H+/gluconate symporter-like permease
MLSWMNDSGSWAISELSGFAEQETLQSWTAVRPTISLVGFIVRWIKTTVLPLSPP